MEGGGDEAEDIFEDGLLTIFGDVKESHGEPGQVFRYTSSAGIISVHIANIESFAERVKTFAHFVWNAAILTADLISSAQFPVAGESVLELGAGTGLPGIVAALEGADLVVLSDYKSSKLLANLERNVAENISANLKDKVKVEGHIWGQDGSAITRHRKSFSRIIAADCYWMSDQHDALVWSLTHFLEKSFAARIFMVAGLHTGRSVISNFFRVAGSQGLLPDDNGIVERNVVNGNTRVWEEEREMEDLVERKQWLVVARLKWCLF